MSTRPKLEIMRPYATTIYQLFILFIGSVFTMTSCEPVTKEQTSFNNPEPITGFEHTVTFDFQGTKMVIPYGSILHGIRKTMPQNGFPTRPGRMLTPLI